MSITVKVGLLSGTTATLEASVDELVGALNFGGRLHLESAAGSCLTHLVKLWMHVQPSRMPDFRIVTR